MSEIVSLCGYRCDLCPAYNENTKSISDRQKVSDGWLKYFGAKVPPEETGVCVGCLNEGKPIVLYLVNCQFSFFNIFLTFCSNTSLGTTPITLSTIFPS